MREHFKHLISDPRIVKLRAISPSEDLFYLVGGAVRDALLGKKCHDLDFTTRLRADEVVKIFSENNCKVIPTGIAFETITVLLDESSSPIQISSYRGTGASLLEDLSLRDFSINSMALSLNEFKLEDPQGGEKDLRNKILRANGNAEKRFKEDALRILRLIRLSSELEFKIDETTLNAAKTCSELLKDISIERLTEEFIKILISARPRSAFHFLRDIDFFTHYLPELKTCIGFEQNEFHIHDVFEHTLDVIELCKPEKLLRLSALFHDIAKPPSLSVDEDGRRHFYLHEKLGAEMMPDIGKRLRLSNDLTKAIQCLVLTHMRPLECGDGGLRRILRDTGDLYPTWRELKWADTISVLGDTEEQKNNFLDFDTRMEAVRNKATLHPFSSLNIGGKDLIELGLTPGPKFKDILGTLSEKVLENPDLNTRDQLLSLVREEFITQK